MPSTPKGWYSRHYLPHFDSPGVVQTVTFRLADSLPAHILRALEEARACHDPEAVREQWQESLDAGHGSCVLSDPRIASLVQDAFLHFDGDRYRLLAWVVMPNHVHVVAEMLEGHALASIVQSWKRHTARQANILLDRQGPLWQSDYYDRYVRNAAHYDQALAYVHNNPVAAHLVGRAEDWAWSSAAPQWQGHASSAESQVTLL